jgi:ATP-dependent DNA helicase RecQ
MPKTVEHYQQETGRAGRDGLAAECVLLYSAGDGPKWLGLMERSAAESDADPASIREGLAVSRELLKHMQQIVGSARCRHAALSEYFGQRYTPPRHRAADEGEAGPGGAGGMLAGCGACDVCLGELEAVPDATTIARKILSCVYRVGQRFGTAHVADVLKGSKAAKIVERGHDQLSTFGLLKDMPRERIVQYIQQLVDMGLLDVEVGDYPLLRLASASGPILRGEREVTLFRQRGVDAVDKRAAHIAGARLADATPALSPDEKGLFEDLRLLRRDIAAAKGVPPYVVFGDVTLEELSRVRPSAVDKLLGVRGIGNIKLQEFGAAFVQRIAAYCAAHNLALDATEPARRRTSGTRQERVRDAARLTGQPARDRLRADAVAGFERGESLAVVASKIGLTPSTTSEHLCAWIELTKPASVEAWVDKATYARVEAAIDEVGGGLLRPVWEHLEGQVPYEQIKVVVSHLRISV